MSASTIEWLFGGRVWNPVHGCTPVDGGCSDCYARRMAHRLRGRCGYPEDEPFRLTLRPDRLGEAAGVPFFLKKAEIDGRLVSMPALDGRAHNAAPEGLRP